MKNIKGLKALVTGGGSGLGKAIALALATEGVEIAITGRNEQKLQEVVKEIQAKGVKATYSIFDVANREEVEKKVEEVEKEFGAFDILINNAGIAEFGNFLDVDPEKWENIVKINLMGPYYMMRAVLPSMMTKKAGDIINVSSTAGLKGATTTSAYSASKFGLVGLSESVMQEMRKHNIRISALTPSTIASDMSKALKLTDGNPDKVLQPEDFADLVVAILKLNNRALLTTASLFSTNP